MNLLTPAEISVLVVLYGITLISVVWFKTHTESHAEGFLAANRNVPLWRGALSIAVTWVWAPAIFVCSLQSFTKGLPGIFWFTAPNILCFFAFAPLGIRLRKLIPKGYTLPEFISVRFPDSKPAHIAFLLIFFGYQLGAIIINTLAGGSLLNTISGINIYVAIAAMAVIALTYSLLSGLRASILTDVIQMTMLLGIAFVLIPWCIVQSGGWQSVVSGLGGVDGLHGNIFDPWIAFSLGIPMTLSLLSGPIVDQVFFQRAIAVKQKDIAKTFIYGGLIFGLVPITLSLLGFIGATEVNKGVLTVPDPQLVGPIVVGHLLPKGALYAFTLMAFAGLCSTLDSSLCAISSLGSIDIYRKYFKPEATDHETVRAARWYMLIMTVLGTGIALCRPKLLWCFLAYGAMASAGLFPTVFALYWKRLTDKGVFWAILLSLVIGTPLSIYANVTENPYLIVTAAILSVGIGLIVCLVSGFTNQKAWFDFALLHQPKPIKLDE